MIELTKQAQRLLESMESWGKRSTEAESLALVDVAGTLLTLVKNSAPQIEGESYAQDLEVVFVPGSPPMAGVIHPGKTMTAQGDMSKALIYILPNRNANQQPTGAPQSGGGWVSVFSKYNPWPASMVPAGADKHARLVTRKVSEAEINRTRLRLKGLSPRIQSELRGAGFRDFRVGVEGGGIVGATLYSDLAFSVLRAEYGYNAPQRSHWRPALRRLGGELSPVQRAFVAFVLRGRDSAFSVEAREVPKEVLDRVERSGFGDRIGNSLGLKKG